jgi:hypothetical protein
VAIVDRCQASTLTYATLLIMVIWRRSDCRRGEGPGAKLAFGVTRCGVRQAVYGVWSGPSLRSSVSPPARVVKVGDHLPFSGFLAA